MRLSPVQSAALAAAQRATAERATRPPAGGQESSLYTSRESGSDAFAYEVMYLLEQVADNAAGVDRLRDTLVGLGDSVSVVGDGAGLWTVHVHSNDIGAAIEAGIEAGRPRQIRVAGSPTRPLRRRAGLPGIVPWSCPRAAPSSPIC